MISNNKPPKILFLSLVFPVESIDSNLYTDLVHSFSDLGIDIRVVAPTLDSQIKGPRVENGISVLRIHTKSLFPKSMFSKALNNLLLPFRYFSVLNFYLSSWRPDWILVPTPPITLAPLVWFLKIIYRAKSYLILRDIFPQNAVDLGLMKTFSLPYFLFRIFEKWTYFNSDLIGCMSPENIRYILSMNNVDSDRIHLLPNWIAERYVFHQDAIPQLRSQYGVLEGKFLCVFGGNLGKPQKVDFLLDVATALRYDARIHFLVVGSGTEIDFFRHQIMQRCLTNITVHSSLLRDSYHKLLGVSDLGIILLNDSFTIPNIPSRLVGYWAAGLPVLAATDLQTDLYSYFLKPFNAGESVRMGDCNSFISKLNWFLENPKLTEKMGANGRDAVIQNYTSFAAAKNILRNIS